MLDFPLVAARLAHERHSDTGLSGHNRRAASDAHPPDAHGAFAPNGHGHEGTNLSPLIRAVVKPTESLCKRPTSAHHEKTPNLRRSHWPQGSGFPVAEEALGANAVLEFESPRLVANAQDITIDGHLVAPDVE